MRHLTCSSAFAALVAASLAISGCGSDGGSTSTSDTGQPPGDTAPPSGDTTSGNNDTGQAGDTSVSGDPCDPNPCTAGQPAGCSTDNDAIETYGQSGTCDNVAGAASCTFPVESTTACTDGTVCSTAGGAATCTTVTDACDYQYSDNASYLTLLQLASQITVSDGDPPDHCCFDFDDDGIIDNKLGELVQLIGALPAVEADPNQVIADNIVNGTITVLLEFVGLDDPTADPIIDPDVTLNGYYGDDTDEDHENNVAGMGVFTARKSSFVEGTAQPIINFPGTTINGGLLRAGPSVFELRIPLANGLLLNADINEARIEGNVSASVAGGVALDGGTEIGARLGGTIPLGQLFGVFNDFADNLCDCIDTGEGRLLQDDGNGNYSCNGNSDACDPADQTQANCITLVDTCPVALLLVQPDIDTSDDGKPDSMSVGVYLKATGARIEATEPALCQ